MNRKTLWASTLTISTLLIGIVTAGPAFARDHDDHEYGRHHIETLTRDIHADERHLDDLCDQRSSATHHRDWDCVHRLDHEISDLRIRISDEKRDLHRDIEHRDHDRY